MGKLGWFLFASSFLLTSVRAETVRFAPFKDDLFVYASLLATGAGGAFRRFEYDELRDVNGRDAKPGRIAKRKYIFRLSGGFKREQLRVDGVSVAFMAAGAKASQSKVTLAYIHGNGGNMKQGTNSRSFGGNFGRLHNLLVRAGGRFVSAGFLDFEEKGAAQIAALVRHHKSASPAAPFFLACGSQGSLLCWRVIKSGAPVDGIVVLGGWMDSDLIAEVRAGRLPRIPVYVAHGSRDPVAPWQRRKAAVDRVRSVVPGYPIRMDLFDGGIHGTPIRMIDWRGALNFMAQNIPKR